MGIRIIGAGIVAPSLRAQGDRCGPVVFSNGRGPESLSSLVERFGPQASAALAAIAAEERVVLPAVPWPNVEGVLRALPRWEGQILIDATNAFADGTPAGGLVDCHGGSSSEHVASLAPGARVM